MHWAERIGAIVSTRTPAMPEEVRQSTVQQPARLRLMVSSTVYGLEGYLEQVFAILESYGYEVWMSHKGTISTNPKKTAFANCLAAVNASDAFLGIITGNYGSGVGPNKKSITHREIIRAVSQRKLRWFLVHHDVVIARQLLKQFRFDSDGKKRPDTFFKKTAVLDDIRVLDMYECAIRHSAPLARRAGNWVQEYSSQADALRFIEAQFREPSRIQRLRDE
jgi:hypothetical protein